MPLIYCVEDDESIRELVSYAMRGQGYKVEGFGDSGEFYEAVQKDVPDLILLDIMLPGEDGLSILKKIRSAGPLQNVPVIMMTADRKSTRLNSSHASKTRMPSSA